MDTKESARRQFLNALLESGLSQAEKSDFSALVARDITNVRNPKKKGTTFHRPKDMVDFLYQFSKNESLKWFTHDPDVNPVKYGELYADALKNVNEEINERNLNIRTIGQVKSFINPSEFKPCNALGKSIEYSWRNAIVWILSNPGSNPFTDLVFEHKPFSEYVKEFKHAIEFRTDIPELHFDMRLLDLIYNHCSLSDDIKNNLDIRESIPQIGNSLKTYIDVKSFFAALKQIFKWVDDNKAQSQLAYVDLFSDDDSYELRIFHQGSKLVINDKKISGMDGDFEKVRQYLFCVADWTMEADRLTDGASSSVRIECLNEDTQGTVIGNRKFMLSENKIETLKEPVGGVRHIIRFYKNR